MHEEALGIAIQRKAGRQQIDTMVQKAAMKRQIDRDRDLRLTVDALVVEIQSAIASDRYYIRKEFASPMAAIRFERAADEAGHRVRRTDNIVDVFWSDVLPPSVDPWLNPPPVFVSAAVDM